MSHIFARQKAEAIFSKRGKEGTLETGWMNTEDKEAFIAPIALAIAHEMDKAAALLESCRMLLVQFSDDGTPRISIVDPKEAVAKAKAAIVLAGNKDG